LQFCFADLADGILGCQSKQKKNQVAQERAICSMNNRFEVLQQQYMELQRNLTK
jgi:hypothetical protein